MLKFFLPNVDCRFGFTLFERKVCIKDDFPTYVLPNTITLEDFIDSSWFITKTKQKNKN